MGTLDKIEEYLESVEELVISSLSAATPDIPTVRETVVRIWHDITRYGPQMPSFPDVHIPGLKDFQVPPPPPPPPPPSTWLDKSAEWVERNPWRAAGIVTSIMGAGLLAGYGRIYMKARRAQLLKELTSERRQAVVVLGGDMPLALPLILELEKKGYIIIASVSTPEAVEVLEHKCQGYVRALVLDPNESATVVPFLRSLTSSLSRRFPITAAGDPFASPASHPYIHSVISLLTLSSPAVSAPLEHVSLHNTYLPYLNATQITPLHVIQALLPLMRTGPSRGREKSKKSIIVCLPATDVRVGLPFAGIQAMSAAGTLRAVEVLRREIKVAALNDKSEAMRHIKVVTVDVGTFNVGTPSNYVAPEHVYKAMDNWSASEKLTYGPAFASMSHRASAPKTLWHSIFEDGHRYGIPRKPTDVTEFIDSLVGVVSGGRFGPSLYGFGLGIGRIRNWIRGERFSVGAGATTYKFASFLPSLLLETLLNIPHVLISIRNSLLTTQPFVRPPVTSASLPTPHVTKPPEPQPQSESEHDDSGNDLSETGSEADVESNSGNGTGVRGSWVSLNRAQVDVGQA